MSRRRNALLTLTMLALLVSIINGAFDMIYNMQRTFEASVATDAGERLSVRVVADSGRPPFLWYLAWRVSGQRVSTVNLGVTITPSGTNVGNLKVTYYVKGVSGTHEKKFLSATDLTASSGQQIQNSTGDVDIDTHLSQMGLSTNQDQTVNYVVYCRVEATGAVSGETLVAEVSEVQFDTVTYDYGAVSSGTAELEPTDDTYAWSGSPDDTFGSSSSLTAGTNIYGDKGRAFLKFDLSDYQDAEITNSKLKVYVTWCGSYAETFWAYLVPSDSWSGSTLTWNNQPSLGSQIGQASAVGAGGYWTCSLNDTVVEDEASGDGILSIAVKGEESGSQKGMSFASKEHSSYYHPHLIFDYTIYDWSASWSWFNLPLSVVSLPIGQQFLAAVFMAFAFAVWAAAREKARRRRRK